MGMFYYKSPVGILEITCKEDEIISIRIVDEIKNSKEETPFAGGVKRQLEEYFLGKREKFDIKINPEGTPFQKLVWMELQKIPYGKTKSYFEVALAIGNKNAQRAVGSACNKNPIIIAVPCHRVISKNGNIGGFEYGVKVKEKLLELERKNLPEI